jgi:hypothetical protein
MTLAVVAGAIANKPHNGGEAWVRASWAEGLRRLGFQVQIIEEIDPAACVDAAGKPCAVQDSANLAYFREVTRRFGMGGAATLVCRQSGRSWGLQAAELDNLAAAADLLVNISGHLTLPAFLDGSTARKAYVDLDPGFTQYWHADGALNGHLERHDFHFTVGQSVGGPGCPIPTGGLDWKPVRQPVVLESWPYTPSAEAARFTTVASWRGGYGPVSHQGGQYGLKVHEFRKILPLPQRAPQRFEIALDIHPADAEDRARLRQHGWHVVDPRPRSASPDAFQQYVQGSDAEFSVAQGIYVETASGWFSDRSVRYLAAGKPALLQETGFSDHLPTGDGLLAFRTLEEAEHGADSIASDYRRHAEAARSIAEAYFDSDRVLSGFVEAVGVEP